jgi:heptosyltransferase-3
MTGSKRGERHVISDRLTPFEGACDSGEVRPPKRSRVLVVVRGHIGDLIQATPSLRALRVGFPDAHIAVLVNEYSSGVLEGCPYINETIHGFAYEERSRLRRVWDIARLTRRLFGRFDVVIGLRFAPASTALLARAIGARTRVGFSGAARRPGSLTHDLGRQPRDVSNRIINLMPLRALDVEGDPAYEQLTWAGPDVGESVERMLASLGDVGDGQSYAALQISCNWGCNELHSSKWAEIIDRLAEDHGLRSIVVGTDDIYEKAKYGEVLQLATHPPLSLHGRTSLPELLEVVRRASLVIATDSALTQIALAQRVPSVIMFGIEPCVDNGPLEVDGDTMEVIQHWEGWDLAPSPNPNCRFVGSYCHSNHCRENSSLAATTVDEVLNRVARVLDRTRQR